MGTPALLWECEMGQRLWKTVWQFLKKKKKRTSPDWLTGVAGWGGRRLANGKVAGSVLCPGTCLGRGPGGRLRVLREMVFHSLSFSLLSPLSKNKQK